MWAKMTCAVQYLRCSCLGLLNVQDFGSRKIAYIYINIYMYVGIYTHTHVYIYISLFLSFSIYDIYGA